MANSDEGMYLIRVQTGDRYGAGTASKISLKLESSEGRSFTIDNLVHWGIMKPGHNYFQRDNLDFFKGTGPCLDVCKITVTSDGKGTMPGWYVDFVEISVTGNSLLDNTRKFEVNTWLDTSDSYQLSATVNLSPAP
ncbi:hypothetical protein K1719_014821 [Acacia pycnantha]|nr:hypothetical protein K1719_014821 [Acacia pycnantha]